METQILQKEELVGLKFTTKEVIHDLSQKKNLMSELSRAQTLGNLEKIKVRIVFHLESGIRGEVETTVWGVGENHLMLKKGIHIPIRAIESISYI
jgi:hypothetical protein